MLTQEEFDKFIEKAIYARFFNDKDHQLTDQDIKEIVHKATLEQFFSILSLRDADLLNVVRDKEEFFNNKALMQFVLKYHPLWDHILFLFKEEYLDLLSALFKVADLTAYHWHRYAHLVPPVARILYWKTAQPEIRDALDKLCESAKATLPPFLRQPLEVFFAHSHQVTRAEALTLLFGSDCGGSDFAIKNAIAEIYALLTDPAACMPYLEFINIEFLRYFRETHQREFPLLSPHLYTFKLFSGLFFPVPTSNAYVGIEKKSALQDFLLLFLQRYGLASDVLKWIGFIPNDIANRMVSDGVFFTEGLNNAALFHGKLSHILQITIVICAIQDGKIQADTAQMKDILRLLVTTRRPAEDRLLWGSVFDSGAHTVPVFSFRDPHILHSTIMYYRGKYKIEGLSDSLIDTHCRRYIKLVNYYNEFGFNLSLESFAEKTTDESLIVFSPPKSIIAISKQRSKGTLQEQGEAYAVFRKQYFPNRLFKPSAFTRPPSSEFSPANNVSILASV